MLAAELRRPAAGCVHHIAAHIICNPKHASHKRARVLQATTSKKAAVGIDLGTTNSVVAVLREGDTRPVVIADSSSGSFTVPSVIAYDAATGQKVIAGQAARQQAAANPANTFYSVKRLMGRGWDEVQGLREGLTYTVLDSNSSSSSSAGGGVQLDCPSKSTTLAPEQVSAELLRYLLNLASQHLNDGDSAEGSSSSSSSSIPQQVVITVPAYFNAQQRAATLKAAKLAGIQQVSLLQEPVAAAMAFGFGKPYEAETLLVFDLGGGTFDLSVVDSFEGIMEVLVTGGDAFLGGDDFDTAILQGLLTRVEQQQQQAGSSVVGTAAAAAAAAAAVSSTTNTTAAVSTSKPAAAVAGVEPGMLVELLEAVEAAKCQLSTQESVQIPLSPAAATQLGLTHPQQEQQQQQQPSVQLTRQQMHALTAGLRQRLWQPLQRLAEACKLQYACSPGSIERQLQGGKPQEQQELPAGGSSNGSAGSSSSKVDPYAPKPRQLTAVLLVGGATRMPIIQQGLQMLTGLQPRCEVDPEQAVALGAAIQAAVLLGLSSGVELMDGSYVEEFHDRSTGF